MLTPDHPIECAQARDAASARLDGALSELDELRLEAHLDTCADCRSFAVEGRAIAAVLRASALEQPGRPMFAPVPQRRPLVRRPLVRAHAAAAAVVLLAAATGSSFALGRVLGGHHRATLTATGSADLLSLRADSTRQHLLAMIGRTGPDGSMNVGKAIAL
jgi:predicted anti-sigma-YlaC factor YlaD